MKIKKTIFFLAIILSVAIANGQDTLKIHLVHEVGVRKIVEKELEMFFSCEYNFISY